MVKTQNAIFTKKSPQTADSADFLEQQVYKEASERARQT
jgi:hypothetical protein